MEDVHRLILWNSIHTDNCVKESYSASKRQKIQNLADNDDKVSSSPITNFLSTRAKETNLRSLETRVSFFVVCDGHGGVQAAEFVNAHLFNNIISFPSFEADPEKAIFEGFAITEEAYSNYAQDEDIDGMVGTTVTCVFIVGNVIYIANVGDSEAVLCNKGKEFVLTEAHIPSNPSEKKELNWKEEQS